MSYNPGNFYGNDQLIFEPYDPRDLLNFNNVKPMMDITDSNSVSNINNIKNMETRLLNKIKNIRPFCNKNPYCVQYPNEPSCTVSLFSPEGAYIEQNRMDIRKNIEDYYFGDRYYKPSDGCANRPPHDCNNPQSEHFFNQSGGNMYGINNDMNNGNNINYGNMSGGSGIIYMKNKRNGENNRNIRNEENNRKKESMNITNINDCNNNNKNFRYTTQLIDFLQTNFSGDKIGDNLIYLFLLFCIFIIISQNNNITYLNKIIGELSKKKSIEQ